MKVMELNTRNEKKNLVAVGGEVIGIIGVIVNELVIGGVEVVAISGGLSAVEVVEGLDIVGIVHIVLRLHLLLLLQKIRVQKEEERKWRRRWQSSN